MTLPVSWLDTAARVEFPYASRRAAPVIKATFFNDMAISLIKSQSVRPTVREYPLFDSYSDVQLQLFNFDTHPQSI